MLLTNQTNNLQSYTNNNCQLEECCFTPPDKVVIIYHYSESKLFKDDNPTYISYLPKEEFANKAAYRNILYVSI